MPVSYQQKRGHNFSVLFIACYASPKGPKKSVTEGLNKQTCSIYEVAYIAVSYKGAEMRSEWSLFRVLSVVMSCLLTASKGQTGQPWMSGKISDWSPVPLLPLLTLTPFAYLGGGFTTNTSISNLVAFSGSGLQSLSYAESALVKADKPQSSQMQHLFCVWDERHVTYSHKFDLCGDE